MSDKASDGQPGEDGAATPRWVKVSGIVAAILVVVFAVLHLTGNGMGRHVRHRPREAPHSAGTESP